MPEDIKNSLDHLRESVHKKNSIKTIKNAHMTLMLNLKMLLNYGNV